MRRGVNVATVKSDTGRLALAALAELCRWEI